MDNTEYQYKFKNGDAVDFFDPLQGVGGTGLICGVANMPTPGYTANYIILVGSSDKLPNDYYPFNAIVTREHNIQLVEDAVAAVIVKSAVRQLEMLQKGT